MSRFACADLHIHTTVSDGSEDFEQVIYRARALGLSHIAFTNHDTLAGIAAARALVYDACVNDARAHGDTTGPRDTRASSVRTHADATYLHDAHANDTTGVAFPHVIGGIEISAWDSERNAKTHILGLGFRDERASAIRALCAPTLVQRRSNGLWQLEQLLEHGYAVDVEKVWRLSETAACIYKQHLMAGLTDAPLTSDTYQSLYRSLFKGGNICDRGISYVDARDAVRAIIEDGGIAVLAHPGQFDNYALVPVLVAVGLSGIEKYHPDHRQRDWRIIDQLAGDYGLVCTGGSDYHGRFGAPAQPGIQMMTAASDDSFLAMLV